MLLEAPSRGVKQKLEELYEALSKKHAMEFAKLMKEYEEMRTSENDTNEDEVVKDQGLKNKIAEILSLMKDTAGTFTEQEMKDTQRLRKMRCLATSSSCLATCAGLPFNCAGLHRTLQRGTDVCMPQGRRPLVCSRQSRVAPIFTSLSGPVDCVALRDALRCVDSM